ASTDEYGVPPRGGTARDQHSEKPIRFSSYHHSARGRSSRSANSVGVNHSRRTHQQDQMRDRVPGHEARFDIPNYVEMRAACTGARPNAQSELAAFPNRVSPSRNRRASRKLSYETGYAAIDSFPG